MLPVGISFYTFQALCYTIDVYRGALEARRNLLDFATFVSFFPQLVAGPIERARTSCRRSSSRAVLDPTLARAPRAHRRGASSRSSSIADNVGRHRRTRSSRSRTPGFELLWAGVFAFAMQIYADFSAYSDIARGTARWLGFDLMRNFDHPYLAHGAGGVLAALAHLALELVPRLRLHSARRIARRPVEPRAT